MWTYSQSSYSIRCNRSSTDHVQHGAGNSWFLFVHKIIANCIAVGFSCYPIPWQRTNQSELLSEWVSEWVDDSGGVDVIQTLQSLRALYLQTTMSLIQFWMMLRHNDNTPPWRPTWPGILTGPLNQVATSSGLMKCEPGWKVDMLWSWGRNGLQAARPWSSMLMLLSQEVTPLRKQQPCSISTSEHRACQLSIQATYQSHFSGSLLRELI